MLGEVIFTNASRIAITSIGEGDNALLFLTDNSECCREQGIGECFYPDGELVGVRRSNDEVYRNRGDQVVRLNRQNPVATGKVATPGLYCCTVPNKAGVMQYICAHLQ